MKILAFARMGGLLAISSVRTLWPLRELNKRPDFECRIVNAEEIGAITRGEASVASLLGYDIYILSRIHGPAQGNPLGELTDDGAKVVYETDDDLTDSYRDMGYGGWVSETIELVDAVTASTPHLGRLYRRLYKKPTHVLPNLLDTQFYSHVSKEAQRKDERLTIGLVGTQTHWADWMLPFEALKRIKAEHPEVLIVTAGYAPKYMQGMVDFFIAPVPFTLYPALLRQIDIRLCPLEPGDQFNLSKSSIAAMEAMAAARPVGKDKLGGAVPIVSKSPVFKGTVTHGRNGLVVEGGDWYTPIKEAVTNEVLRRRLARTGHAWVRKHRNVRGGVARRAAVYQAITEGNTHG